MTTTDPNSQPVTTDAGGVPTATPQPKVIAATTGAGIGAAVSTIGIWAVETYGHIDLPVAVEGAILVLITAGVGFLAGYFKRPSASAS